MNGGNALTILEIGLLILAAYLLGSIPFGYLLVRLGGGGDIRRMGSGNVGATNVAREAGIASGLATLLLDAFKGYAAVWLAVHFSGGNIRLMMAAGIAAILGHLFPVWLGFRGGRGVATAVGVFIPVCWPAVAGAFLVWLVVVLFWRYVSLGSISAAASLPLLVYLLYAPQLAPPTVVSAGTILASALIIAKHRSNILRLVAGAEPRFEFRRKNS